MRAHDAQQWDDKAYRDAVKELHDLRKEFQANRRLKKRLREWIKEEDIEPPEDIKKMIGRVNTKGP